MKGFSQGLPVDDTAFDTRAAGRRAGQAKRLAGRSAQSIEHASEMT
jgi:hypothetical protein